MKYITLALSLMIFSQSSFAVTGLKEALDQYQYNVTVEWDQNDKAQLLKYDQELAISIETLVREGNTPDELFQEVLSLSQDQNLNAEMIDIVNAYKTKNISADELIALLKEKSNSLYSQGSSWHPAVKVILGIVGAYVILKALMLTIYYWDTEDVDCSIQDCTPPPTPKT